MNARQRKLITALSAAFAASACSPSLDWREVRPADSGARALFPCKPVVESRGSGPAGAQNMGLAQCSAAGLSFSLSWAEVPDPAQVTQALREMRLSLAGKLAAAPEGRPQTLRVPGMTPNPEALQQRFGGAQQQAQLAVFTRGTRVYQALMLGPKRNEAAWESFVTSLRVDE